MLIAYTLSMPRANSWNGRWSGEERPHVVIESIRSKEAAAAILRGGPYFYNWPDGWGARIDVREVTPAESRKLRAKSCGFAGYEWMLRTIRLYGKPMADHEVKQHLQEKECVA